MKKKKAAKGQKNLSKNDFLRFHRKGKIDVDPSEYDELSQAALEGARYQKENPAATFSRMEEKLGIKTAAPKPIGIRQALAIAAGFLVLLSVAYLALFQADGLSGEALFQEHYSALSYIDDDLQRGTRTQGSVLDNVKAKAISAYTAEDYEKAEALFQLYLNEENTEDRTARFFYGITLLKRGKLQPAISIFKDTKNNPPVAAIERPATFYLALAYIRQNEHEQALPLLQSLTDQQDRYGKDARDVLTDYGY